ncbi:MAG: hypothetical protein HY001_01035 [Candidatus Portnoybacteria bacterium]|nr:hypothetical protein [Candidatus Portnoybacteria bacterium]
MVYLIGIKHEFQHNGHGGINGHVREKFISCLENEIKIHSVFLVAEEFSEEALQKSDATISTLKHVADKLKINHFFCDPNTEERKIIGIPSREEIKNTLNIKGPVYENSVDDNRIEEEQRKYHQIRENFWLEKIKIYLKKPIIFLCGLDHLENFKLLLDNKGYETEVLVLQLND